MYSSWTLKEETEDRSEPDLSRWTSKWDGKNVYLKPLKNDFVD